MTSDILAHENWSRICRLTKQLHRNLTAYRNESSCQNLRFLISIIIKFVIRN